MVRGDIVRDDLSEVDRLGGKMKPGIRDENKGARTYKSVSFAKWSIAAHRSVDGRTWCGMCNTAHLQVSETQGAKY
jgi:hypothetical protein